MTFARLCEVAERNGLRVEVWTDPEGDVAVWVVDDGVPFKVGEAEAVMRRAVVASPFTGYPAEAHAPQLVRMLAERGYV